jgi:hypothetical protein
MPSQLDNMISHLKHALTMPSSVDEGTDGGHGSIIGTGDSYNYLTHPATPVVNDGGAGSGTIKYPYTCRQRHKHYVSQVETGTSDHEIDGYVTCKFDFTFSGKVLISDISNHGKQGRSGNSIESHLDHLNGANVG